MSVLYSVAVIIGLLACTCDGQVAPNNTAAVKLDERIVCLIESIGWSGECYKTAVITVNDETKLRDHCAIDTQLFQNLESFGCNSTINEAIFHCLCPNVSSNIIKNLTSSSGLTGMTTSISITNSTDADTLITVNAFENFTAFVYSLDFSDSCREAVLNITSSPSSSIQLCLKLKDDNDSMVSHNCSPTDYDKIYASVCLTATSTQQSTVSVGTTQREIVTFFPKIVVNATLQDKIRSYINLNLSSTCRYSISPRVPTKITDLRRPCKMFRQSGEALIANRICSGDEVTTLTNIFCYATFHGAQIPDTEDGRRELASFLIGHGLSQSCHSLMQPQVDQFQESLAIGCDLLTKAKDLLVQTGMCTEMDIAKLDPVVCYVEPLKDNSTTLSPEEQKHRDMMETLVQQMSENCSEDIHKRFSNILESGSEDTCHVVFTSYDVIRRNSSCTEKELSSLSKSVCAGPKVAVISLVLLLICLFVSVVENNFFS